MNNACASQPCNNKCCEENPCFNGGTYTELTTTPNKSSSAHAQLNITANSVTKKFQHLVSSFKSRQRSRESDVCTMYDPTSKSLYQTFCDFTSENGAVWTLLESFSLANKNDFKAQPFDKDYPVNLNSFK